jgi:hypothetical protein
MLGARFGFEELLLSGDDGVMGFHTCGFRFDVRG